jgi:hypothetical protein
MKNNFANAFAYAKPASYGIYRVIVTIDYAGEQRDLSAISNDIEAIECIREMEDEQEKYDAFHELIESKIADELEEWQLEIEEAEDRESRELAYEFATDYNPEDKD